MVYNMLYLLLYSEHHMARTRTHTRPHTEQAAREMTLRWRHGKYRTLPTCQGIHNNLQQQIEIIT